MATKDIGLELHGNNFVLRFMFERPGVREDGTGQNHAARVGQKQTEG